MTTGLTALPETLAALDGAEAALFDYDGTLVDSVPLLWEVYADLARVLGGTPCASDFEGDFEGTPIPTLMQRLACRLKSRRPLSELTALHGRMARARCARQGPRPAAGAGELLARLRRRGRVLALVTSAERRWVAAPLDSLGWTSMFDVIVSAEDVRRVKPAPDAYLFALKRLGRPAETAVAFEDSEAGRKAAEAAGTLVIAVGERTGGLALDAIARAWGV